MFLILHGTTPAIPKVNKGTGLDPALGAVTVETQAERLNGETLRARPPEEQGIALKRHLHAHVSGSIIHNNTSPGIKHAGER